MEPDNNKYTACTNISVFCVGVFYGQECNFDGFDFSSIEEGVTRSQGSELVRGNEALFGRSDQAVEIVEKVGRADQKQHVDRGGHHRIGPRIEEANRQKAWNQGIVFDPWGGFS